MVNSDGHKKMPVANSHGGGAQASCCGDELVSGSAIMGVNNPRGIAPKKMASGGVKLVQEPMQTKVGK